MKNSPNLDQAFSVTVCNTEPCLLVSDMETGLFSECSLLCCENGSFAMGSIKPCLLCSDKEI